MTTFTKTSRTVKQLLLAFILVCSSRLVSQTLNFTVNPATQCAAQYTTMAQAAVTSTMAGTTSYSWTFGCTSCNPLLYYNAYNSSASSIGIAYLNVGTTTVTCFAYSGSTIIGSVTKTLQVLASPPAFSISSSNPANICIGPTVTLTASGAGSHTWLPMGTVANSIAITPTASNCYTAITANANNCTYSVSYCMNVATSAPILSLSTSGNFSLCLGYAMIIASGANTYTWSTNQQGSQIQVNTLGCYSVAGTNGCGTSTAVSCATGTMNPPSVSVIGSNTVCSGGALTLFANGANGLNTYPNYYWFGPNYSSGMTSSITITPTASGCYTLLGQNAVCGSNTIFCVTVQPGIVPTLTINGLSSFCQGSSVVFTVNGSASSYTWNNASTNTLVTLSPTTSACLSVIGSNTNGCSSFTSKCFTVWPTPSLMVLGNNSVCVGSSITLTASGANTYTWSPVTNTSSTLSMIPLSSGIYTVSGNLLNSPCQGNTLVAITVNTACAIVWPGDANRDGLVDNTDVFELGLAAGSTGALRSGASISWSGQYANAWSGTVSSGWNKCHADCNGDGVVNNADTLAIYNNYANTHSFRPSAGSFNPDLSLTPQQAQAYAGVWNVMDIVLGDAGNPISQIYGAGFDLDFDKTMVESDSVKLVYNSSFLNAANQNITFGKQTFTNGNVFAATVRTDAGNVTGNGKIGEVWFKLKTGLAENSSFYFGISNGKRASANGSMGLLTTMGQMNLTITNNLTALKAHANNSLLLTFYPNPAKDKLLMENAKEENTDFTLMDISGRTILKGSFTGKNAVDVSGLDAGTYFIQFDSVSGKKIHKLILER